MTSLKNTTGLFTFSERELYEPILVDDSLYKCLYGFYAYVNPIFLLCLLSAHVTETKDSQ